MAAGLKLIHPTELYNLLNEQKIYPCLSDPVHILLIDARTRDDYNEGHVITSKLAPMDESDGYVAPYDADLECKTHIVVYDSHTNSLTEDTNATRCANKMWDMGSRNPVKVLQGGYEDFSAFYPFLRTQKIIYMPRELDAIETYPAEIIPHRLYLGNWKHGNSPHIQRELKVKAHVNCTEEQGTFYTEVGDSLMQICVPDSPNPNASLYPHFQTAFTFIDGHVEEGEAVLVYSKRGISRSATIVMAYLMLKNKITESKAYNDVLTCSPSICPNQGFCAQLLLLKKVEHIKPCKGETAAPIFGRQ